MQFGDSVKLHSLASWARLIGKERNIDGGLEVMRADENTQPDHAAGIAGVTPWRVKYVRPLADFRLEVKFADGTQGLVDMARLLARDCGVFKPLRELSLFNQVFVDAGNTRPSALGRDVPIDGQARMAALHCRR